MFVSQLETVWIFLLSQNVDLDSENYFSDTLDLNQTSKPSLKLIMFLELDMHKVITRSNPRELGGKKKVLKNPKIYLTASCSYCTGANIFCKLKIKLKLLGFFWCLQNYMCLLYNLFRPDLLVSPYHSPLQPQAKLNWCYLEKTTCYSWVYNSFLFLLKESQTYYQLFKSQMFLAKTRVL